jgi:hypothetical protein
VPYHYNTRFNAHENLKRIATGSIKHFESMIVARAIALLRYLLLDPWVALINYPVDGPGFARARRCLCLGGGTSVQALDGPRDDNGGR